jgi:hypothetical protein
MRSFARRIQVSRGACGSFTVYGHSRDAFRSRETHAGHSRSRETHAGDVVRSRETHAGHSRSRETHAGHSRGACGSRVWLLTSNLSHRSPESSCSQVARRSRGRSHAGHSRGACGSRVWLLSSNLTHRSNLAHRSPERFCSQVARRSRGRSHAALNPFQFQYPKGRTCDARSALQVVFYIYIYSVHGSDWNRQSSQTKKKRNESPDSNRQYKKKLRNKSPL